MEYERVSEAEFINEDLKVGERVEVEIAPKTWVPASVLWDMEHRVSVKLDSPVHQVEQIVDSVSVARWYIRRPK